MNDNYKITSVFMRALEIYTRIVIGASIAYSAFGLLHLVFNGTKGSSDFPAPPILIAMALGTYLMHLSFSKIRRAIKKIEAAELKIKGWFPELYEPQKRIFLISIGVVILCFIINVYTETFGIEALLLASTIMVLGMLTALYLYLLSKKLVLLNV